MIGMTPDFCNLTYKAIEVPRIILKCDLQRKLMTTVTKKIWHEKLAYDLDEVISSNMTKLQWHKNPETNTAVMEINDTNNGYKEDVNGNHIPVFYNDGDKWQANSAFDTNLPISNTNREYAKDGMDQPIIDAVGTVNAQAMNADSSAYIKDLVKMNKDIANFYIKYRTQAGNAEHIATCLKKHLTHHHMDFYCLTAYGERIDMDKFEAAELTKISQARIDHFVDTTDYEIVETTDGSYIRTASTTKVSFLLIFFNIILERRR